MLSFLNNSRGITSIFFLIFFSFYVGYGGAYEQGVQMVFATSILCFFVFFIPLIIISNFFKSENAKLKVISIPSTILFSMVILLLLLG